MPQGIEERRDTTRFDPTRLKPDNTNQTKASENCICIDRACNAALYFRVRISIELLLDWRLGSPVVLTILRHLCPSLIIRFGEVPLEGSGQEPRDQESEQVDREICEVRHCQCPPEPEPHIVLTQQSIDEGITSKIN